MTRGEIIALRRILAEVKAGFEVRHDPWEAVERLLDEVDYLKAAVVTFEQAGVMPPRLP